MKRFRIAAFLTVAFFSTVHLNAAAITHKVDAILALGSEMSNVRAMLENYTTIGAKIAFKNPGKRLKENIEVHDALMETLKSTFKDPHIQQLATEGLTAWAPVKKALQTAEGNTDRAKMRTQAQFVHDNIRAVIKNLFALKKAFLAQTKIAHPEALNAAIEIAASARRLSAHYMMAMWKLPDPTIQKHWDQGVKIWTDSIAVLKQSDFYKDPAFKATLDDTAKVLKHIVMYASMAQTGSFTPAIVHNKCEQAFEDGNSLAKKILGK